MNFWDREEVMIRIKQMYRGNNDISYTGVLRRYPLLLFAAVHYFPNWGKAVTAAGIDYTKVHRQQVWNRKRIKEELMQYQKAGGSLSYNEFERQHPKILHASLYHFGGWKNVLSAIGVNYRAVRKLEKWNKKKVKERIRTLKEKGMDLSWRAMFRQGQGVVVSMANYYYGSWQRAITRTGLNYQEIKKKPGPAVGWKKKLELKTSESIKGRKGGEKRNLLSLIDSVK